MTQATKSQQTSTRGRPKLAHAGTPWAIAPWRAGCEATLSRSFALHADRRVDIRCRAFALEGNR